jgi:hypothetical protein
MERSSIASLCDHSNCLSDAKPRHANLLEAEPPEILEIMVKNLNKKIIEKDKKLKSKKSVKKPKV